jgi:hypothetical protein
MTINSTGERHTPKKWSILALTIWGIATVRSFFPRLAKSAVEWGERCF